MKDTYIDFPENMGENVIEKLIDIGAEITKIDDKYENGIHDMDLEVRFE